MVGILGLPTEFYKALALVQGQASKPETLSVSASEVILDCDALLQEIYELALRH